MMFTSMSVAVGMKGETTKVFKTMLCQIVVRLGRAREQWANLATRAPYQEKSIWLFQLISA